MKDFDYFFYINYYNDLKKHKINDYASAFRLVVLVVVTVSVEGSVIVVL